MTDSSPTRASLVFRLRDRADTAAWSQFVRDYGPMLYRFVRSRGVQDADAADIVQDVMRSVGAAIGRLDYQKEKGGFRAWLFTITRNKLSTFFEKRRRLQPTGNDSTQLDLLNQVPDQRSSMESDWELEHQRMLAALAMETIRSSFAPNTWLAFRLAAVEGLSAEEVSQQTGLSKGAVYVARSRVTAKLRSEIERLQAIEEL